MPRMRFYYMSVELRRTRVRSTDRTSAQNRSPSARDLSAELVTKTGSWSAERTTLLAKLADRRAMDSSRKAVSNYATNGAGSERTTE
jgi:hypothetical protein